MYKASTGLQKLYRNSSWASSFLLFLTLLVATTVSAWPWLPRVFFGDDLSNFLAFKDGAFASTLTEALFSSYVDKYRPVFSTLMWLLFNLFGKHLDAYLAVNVLVHSLNALLVFVIAKRVSKGNLLFPILAACSIATSRFALYQVTQVTGLLEGVALTLFLLTLYCIVRGVTDKNSAWYWGWGAIILSCLALHTHERYIVVAVWLSIVFLIMPVASPLSLYQRLLLAVAAIGSLLINILYKVLILGMPFFVGTGGVSIGLNFRQILINLQQALLSAFGFNKGPAYLVGINVSDLGRLILILATVFTLTWVIMVLWTCFLTSARKERNFSFVHKIFWPIVTLSAALVLLIPPIFTIRLEQRWILAPFILILLCAAWAIGELRQKFGGGLALTAVSITLGLCPMIIDLRLAPYYKNIFFVYSGEMATAVKHGKSTISLPSTGVLHFMASNDICEWVLQDGQFFRIYGHGRRAVACIQSDDSLLAQRLPLENLYAFSHESPPRLLDVTQEQKSLPSSTREVTLLDLLAIFDKGRVSSDKRVDSPNGKGALRLTWNSLLGKRDTLTVISGFSYKYSGIFVEPNAELRFGLSMLYPSHTRTHAFVRVVDSELGTVTLYSASLTPPKKGTMPSFQAVSLPLEKFTGRKITIELGVTTPSETDASGHWVGFADLRIIKPIAKRAAP